jgi:hypothetical protein
MLEEPAEDQVAPPESIGEEEPRLREDRDEPESEEEQRSSVLFTQEQLEVLLKMGRPDFGEFATICHLTLLFLVLISSMIMLSGCKTRSRTCIGFRF